MLNQTRTTGTLRLIRCGIAAETYGLDMSWVRSIQRTDRLRRNPEAEGPSTPRQARDDASSGQSPSISRCGEPAEPSGHSPVGWLPGNEGDIPVFSLANQLGRFSPAPLSTEGRSGALQRIVVLNPPPPPPQAGGSEGVQPWALLVDRVSQVIQIPADRVVPLPPIVVNPSADYFKGIIKLDEQLILFLSPERLHPDASLSAGGPVRKAASSSPGPFLSTRSPTASAEGQRLGHGQIVIFSIAELHPGERALSFGLSISQVPEILEPLPMIPVPAAPAFVLGLVNWRDRPVPVIDLASRLGLAPEANRPANGRTCLIVARDKGHVLPVPSPALSPVEGIARGSSSKGGSNQGAWVGFLARPGIRVLRLPIAHQPCSRTLPLDQTLTRGIVELENETLVIPDIRGILWRDG
jgi:chemotaxis signal transduction protein